MAPVCLVVLALRPGTPLPLLVAANRDEFHARPTAKACAWPDAPGVFAGRDLEAGGTWLGVTNEGRLAAVTNYRDPGAPKGTRSRGELVTGFLRSPLDAPLFFEALAGCSSDYGPFNLLAGDASSVHVFSSRTGRGERLAPGIHGLSNHLLDTPWPKVKGTTEGLAKLLARGEVPSVDRLFELLNDETRAPDAELPETGVGLDMERFLSPPFIVGPSYGTRSSTVLLFYADGRIEFCERSFDAVGKLDGEVSEAVGSR